MTHAICHTIAMLMPNHTCHTLAVIMCCIVIVPLQLLYAALLLSPCNSRMPHCYCPLVIIMLHHTCPVIILVGTCARQNESTWSTSALLTLFFAQFYQCQMDELYRTESTSALPRDAGLRMRTNRVQVRHSYSVHNTDPMYWLCYHHNCRYFFGSYYRFHVHVCILTYTSTPCSPTQVIRAHPRKCSVLILISAPCSLTQVLRAHSM